MKIVGNEGLTPEGGRTQSDASAPASKVSASSSPATPAGGRGEGSSSSSSLEGRKCLPLSLRRKLPNFFADGRTVSNDSKCGVVDVRGG